MLVFDCGVMLAKAWLDCGARILDDMAYTIDLHIEWHKI